MIGLYPPLDPSCSNAHPNIPLIEGSPLDTSVRRKKFASGSGCMRDVYSKRDDLR